MKRRRHRAVVTKKKCFDKKHCFCLNENARERGGGAIDMTEATNPPPTTANIYLCFLRDMNSA